MLRSSRCVEDFLPISGRPENQLTFVRKKQTTFRNRNRSDVRGVLTMKRKIAYVEGPELIRECSRIPAVLGRAHRVSSLIRSTELILPKIIPSIHATDFQRVIPSVADLSAITSFHRSPSCAKVRKSLFFF